jgi:hypothetical protein
MKSTPVNLIEKAVVLAREMIVLADTAEQEACDDGCSVLCGIIRDCAYKIQRRAEQERACHRTCGLQTVPHDG